PFACGETNGGQNPDAAEIARDGGGDAAQGRRDAADITPEGGPDAAETAPDSGPDVTGCAGTASTADSANAATLGGKCTTSADCARCLECVTAGSGEWRGQGPANGYCTKRCRSLSDCKALGPRAGCYSFGQSASEPGYC